MTDHALALALLAVPLAFLAWGMARAAGKAEAQRMAAVAPDLRRGDVRGLAVVGFVVAMIALTNFLAAQ